MKYSYSFDEETYTGHYDSFDEAASAAMEDSESFERECCWIGENHAPAMPWQIPDVNLIIEEVACQDEYSVDWAEGWDQLREGRTISMVEKSLTDALEKWYKENYEIPTHFLVENIKMYTFKSLRGDGE